MRFFSVRIHNAIRIAVPVILLTMLLVAWMELQYARNNKNTLYATSVFSEQPLKSAVNKRFHKFPRMDYVRKQSDSKSSMQRINSSVEN